MPRRDFIPSEAEGRLICQRYLSGEHANQIAPTYMVHGNTIRAFLTGVGVHIRSQSERTDGKIPKSRQVEALKLCGEGYTVVQIAELTGIKKGSLTAVLRRQGVPKRSSIKHFKLSPGHQADLAKEYEVGSSYRELEKKYGVSSIVVRDILARAGIKGRYNWIGPRVPPWIDRINRVFVFKSRWERSFAAHLDRQFLVWDYEPWRFFLKECKCYTPDFRIRFGSAEMYFEVHAQMSGRFSNKILEFMACYPKVRLEILGPAELACLGLIESWYTRHAEAVKVTAFARQVLERQGLKPMFASNLEEAVRAA